MYKRILVPVDGSPTSVKGLREAMRLAKDQNAALRLVHVVDEFLMSSSFGPSIDYQLFIEALRKTGQQTLQTLQAMVRTENLEADTALLETIGGRAADLIVEAAREWPADLIVMGTHGRRGVRRILMGSDAGLVLHSTPVPVLMVRSSEQQPN